MARDKQFTAPKLEEEEKHKADYGHEALVSNLLNVCAEATITIDKNKDGLVQPSEYNDVLWKLQLLQGALSYHLDKEFKDSYKKSREDFEKYANKINGNIPLSEEERKKFNFAPSGQKNNQKNLSLIYKKHILNYYNALLLIVSKMKFLGTGETK